MIQLVRNGGLIVLEEPNPATWLCDPPLLAWDQLKEAVLLAFEISGNDFCASTGKGLLLLGRGVSHVQVRESVRTIAGRHPYSRMEGEARPLEQRSLLS